MSEKQPNLQDRGSFLTLMLTFMGVGGFIVFLIWISDGLLLYAMLGVIGFGAVGLLHYLLWGFTLSRQMAAEREEVMLEEKAREGMS